MSQSAAAMQKYRAQAAELSGGTSGEAIYSMIERVIVEQGLSGRVLDYGAGVGELSRRLLALERFHQVSAADIMARPDDCSGDIHWIEQDLNIPLPGYDNFFDVVVAAEVIEHLENPRFMLREMFRILRPGGTAIVTTPNNESWRSLIALLFRGHYLAFGESNYPAHITALLRMDLTRIFQESCFLSPSFEYTNSGGFPGYPLFTWQQISFGLLGGLRFSDNILAIARKPEQRHEGGSLLQPGM